jgi:hypothetical protein
VKSLAPSGPRSRQIPGAAQKFVQSETLDVGPSLFLWESQSTTTECSPTGQRYIHHASRGSRVLLFVREQRKQGTVTEPFRCLGLANYESHEGERPIPAAWLPVMALVG